MSSNFVTLAFSFILNFLPFTDGKISAYKFVKLSEFGAYSINVNNGTANKSTAAPGGQVSDWATPAMQWAVENGLILGSDKSLNPQGNATRAEVAAILMRYIQLTRV